MRSLLKKLKAIDDFLRKPVFPHAQTNKVNSHKITPNISIYQIHLDKLNTLSPSLFRYISISPLSIVTIVSNHPFLIDYIVAIERLNAHLLYNTKITPAIYFTRAVQIPIVNFFLTKKSTYGDATYLVEQLIKNSSIFIREFEKHDQQFKDDCERTNLTFAMSAQLTNLFILIDQFIEVQRVIKENIL